MKRPICNFDDESSSTKKERRCRLNGVACISSPYAELQEIFIDRVGVSAAMGSVTMPIAELKTRSSMGRAVDTRARERTTRNLTGVSRLPTQGSIIIVNIFVQVTCRADGMPCCST